MPTLPPLIAAPAFDTHLLVSRAHDDAGLEISRDTYDILADPRFAGATMPPSLVGLARRTWNIDLAGMIMRRAVHVRPRTELSYSSASYELNLACDYACDHCYLGEKRNRSLPMAERETILRTMAQAGVLRLQITGGEPLIDRHFEDCYRLAHELGMQVKISSNGSMLWRPKILALLTELPPVRVSLSMYGATAASYESLTNTRSGTFTRFERGVEVAIEAGIPLRVNVIVTRHNQDEAALMEARCAEWGVPHYVYGRMTPTFNGDGKVLGAQATSINLTRRRPVFPGCDAGNSYFHVDPLGRASICKVGREPNVMLHHEGLDGLRRLPAIAKSLLARDGDCSGCSIQAGCSTCPVIVRNYRRAAASPSFFCNHAKKE